MPPPPPPHLLQHVFLNLHANDTNDDWSPSDLGDVLLGLPEVECLLPPDAGVRVGGGREHGVAQPLASVVQGGLDGQSALVFGGDGREVVHCDDP